MPEEKPASAGDKEVPPRAADLQVPFWRRLDIRLTAGLVLIGLIPLALFAAYMLINLHDALRTASEQTLTATARDYSNRVDAWLRKGLQQVDLAGRLPGLKGSLQGLEERDMKIWSELESLQGLGSTDPVYFRSAGIFDTAGRTVELLPADWPVGDPLGKMWFEIPLETAEAAFAFCQKSCDRGELVFSSPLIRAGEPYGVLRIGYDATVLHQLLIEKPAEMNPLAHTYLLDEESRLLAGDRLELPSGWTVGEKLPAGPAREALMPVDYGTVRTTGLMEGLSGEWTAALEPLQEVDWQVVHLVPRDQFVLPLRHRLLVASGIAMGLVLLLILLGYLLSRLLSRDLRQLAAAAHGLGTGDLRIRVPANKRDECGVLARSFNDMAARLQARRDALERARHQAEEASRAKSQFLSVMSHEVRTPLNAVIGYSDLLLSEKGLTDSMRQEVTIIRRSGRQLLEMLNNMLDFSKLEAGRVEVDRRPFPVMALLTEVVEQTAAAASAKGLEIILEPVGCVPETLVADGPKLRQILLNLVSNAVKFTADGGVHIYLETDFGLEESGNLLIMVEDTGIGITEDVRQRLFQPFTQGDSSVSRTYGGTGLGLVISRHIATACGGSLTECSPRAGGACFALSVPVHRNGSDNLPVATPNAALRGRKVWLYSENAMHRDFLREQLYTGELDLVERAEEAEIWILDEPVNRANNDDGIPADGWADPMRPLPLLHLYSPLRQPESIPGRFTIRQIPKPVLTFELYEELNECLRLLLTEPQNPNA